MTNFAGLMHRFQEVQSGETRRSLKLIAEDERLMDGLRTRALTREPLQAGSAGENGSERD